MSPSGELDCCSRCMATSLFTARPFSKASATCAGPCSVTLSKSFRRETTLRAACAPAEPSNGTPAYQKIVGSTTIGNPRECQSQCDCSFPYFLGYARTHVKINGGTCTAPHLHCTHAVRHFIAFLDRRRLENWALGFAVNGSQWHAAYRYELVRLRRL
jgi:hypothetical protein